MERLIARLRDQLILDFQGDLTAEQVRELLREDTTPAGRALRARLNDDRAVNDLLIVLADCLLEPVLAVVDDDAVRRQLEVYADVR